MKTIKPMLLAAALLAPCVAGAQTPRPDRSVDTDGTNTVEPTDTERAARTGATRNEPNGTYSRTGTVDRSEGSPAFDKEREQLRSDIEGLKRESDTLRADTNAKGREKLDSLVSRIDELENRAVSADAGTERDFNENKHKYKNEIKKIRRELRDVRKYRTMSPDSAPTDTVPRGMPGNP